MKTRITNYTFNAALSQITFGDYTQILLDAILIITNVMPNIIIYNFADPSSPMGGSVAGNVLTLDYNTSAMSNTDKLLIYYDDNNIPAKDSSIQILESQNDLLRRMVKLMESQAVVDSSNRQRITIDAAAVTVPISAAAVLGVSSGANLPTIIYQNTPYTFTAGASAPIGIYEGPVDQRWRIIDAAKTAFAVGIRSNIK